MPQTSASGMLPRDFLRRCAAAFPDRTALIDGDRQPTWRQLYERSGRLARALQGLGLGKGQASALLGHDHIEVIEHLHACAQIGALRVGVNWRYAEREILHLIRNCDAHVLLVQASCVPQIEGLLAQLRAEGRVLVGYGGEHDLEHDYETLIAGADAAPDWPELDEDDLFGVSYTTGTTGLPKGALWTQRGVRDALTYSSLMLGFRAEDIYFAPFPMAGVPVLCGAFGLFSGMTVLLPGGSFDAQRALELIERHRATTAIFVPTMLGRMVELARAGSYDTSSLRLVTYGSSPASPALIRAAMDTFGCEMMQLYGLTESTAGWLSFLRHEDHLRGLDDRPELLTSCGRAPVHADLSIRDPDGRELPAGEIGELWARSSTNIPGYLGNPQEQAELFGDADRQWLRTQDLGYMDADGYLYLTDRKKFLIISGGYNVYPVTVENVLAEHPAVAEVAVVGAPHPDWGEAVVAQVALRAGEQATPQALIEFCRDRLGAWERPKHVEIVDELPKGVTGKIAKHRIREGYRQQPERLPWHTPD